MKTLADQLGVLDNQGIRHLKTSSKGRPHCGTIDIKISSNGTFALHHPGAECCIPRLEQQVAWRKQELANIDEKLKTQVAMINTTTQGGTINIHEATRNLERKAATHADRVQADLTSLTRKLTELRRHQ